MPGRPGAPRRGRERLRRGGVGPVENVSRGEATRAPTGVRRLQSSLDTEIAPGAFARRARAGSDRRGAPRRSSPPPAACRRDRRRPARRQSAIAHVGQHFELRAEQRHLERRGEPGRYPRGAFPAASAGKSIAPPGGTPEDPVPAAALPGPSSRVPERERGRAAAPGGGRRGGGRRAPCRRDSSAASIRENRTASPGRSERGRRRSRVEEAHGRPADELPATRSVARDRCPCRTLRSPPNRRARGPAARKGAGHGAIPADRGGRGSPARNR